MFDIINSLIPGKNHKQDEHYYLREAILLETHVKKSYLYVKGVPLKTGKSQ